MECCSTQCAAEIVQGTPAWRCRMCASVLPATVKESAAWVEAFDWSSRRSLLFGLNQTGKTGKCIACGRGTIIASTELVLPNYTFPVTTVAAPVWHCTTCAFSDLVVEAEKYLWAEKYKWR